MSIVISVENLSKTYRLGQIGTGTFSRDLELWWAKLRGKPNPLLRIGEKDHGNRDGEELWALRDVSFTVEQGEILGIIGRNGAGKSTLLKILSRVTAPTSGKVKVKGRIASLLEVGTGFHPELTGRENIYLNGAILGMSKQEVTRKFDEIVDFSGVEKFIDTPVKRYSSGMYVRLAFAVAAHLDPEILVVDEVLAVGDAEFQKKCLGKMSDVAHEGRTVLFVSHNMTAINTLCPRTILLSRGNLILDKNTEETINQYLHMGSEEGGKIEYVNFETAPGKDNIRIKAVRVCSNGRVASQINIDENFKVEIEFWNKAPGMRVYSELRLVDSSGLEVFTTVNSPDASLTPDPLFDATLSPGVYKTTCVIPGNFLNDHTYLVTAIIGSFNPAKAEAAIIDALVFQVFDTGTMRTPGLSGKWKGVVRTKFDWSSEKIA